MKKEKEQTEAEIEINRLLIEMKPFGENFNERITQESRRTLIKLGIPEKRANTIDIRSLE